MMEEVEELEACSLTPVEKFIVETRKVSEEEEATRTDAPKLCRIGFPAIPDIGIRTVNSSVRADHT
jgi:hypothetical protein